MRRAAGVCFAASVLAAGCSDAARESSAAAKAPSAEPRVVTVAASQRPFARQIEAIGTALANESVEITAEAEYRVTAIHFAEGQRVRRGALLVALDPTQASADLAAAEAALAESQAQFARSRSLYETRALSEAQLAQIEAPYKTHAARVAVARARLAQTAIRAPFDGRAGFRRVSVGSLVGPGTVITTLDDTSIIKVDFSVPQTLVAHLRQDLPVQARATGIADRTFDGRVTVIGSRLDPVSRSVTARAEVPNEAEILKPGMFMTVLLKTPETLAVVIPEEALVPEHGTTFVFVVSQGAVERREVRVGQRRFGEIEITSGLAAGERVIVEGSQKVRATMRVQEIDAGSAPATGTAESS
jgi:membrane fusion protein (multidrug efflux system)